MIIYNKSWLSNLLLQSLVQEKYEAGAISASEFDNIKTKYPVGFYSPNFFIRVGLFILTLAISLSATGLLSLLFESFISYSWLIFFAVLNYIALHILVKNKFHYRSGVDDALLWITFGFMLTAYNWGTSVHRFESHLGFSAFIFVLSAFFTLRFSDMIMSLVAYLAGIGVVFFAWQQIGPWGITTMPFILMAFSGLMYWLITRSQLKTATIFYANCMVALQAISLIALYSSGNYYVVKELGDLLNNTSSVYVPFGWFFWAWTVIVPAAYIYCGVIKKDSILIRIGLLLCIATALTFRNYYHLMPLELLLILCGTGTLAISWYLTKYLKAPKHGITYQDLSGNNLIDQLKIESLIISETSSGIGNAPLSSGTQMGGGKFGGGGASGEF